MKFYLAFNASFEVLGCEYSKAEAVKLCRTNGGEGLSVQRITLKCKPREAIRALLDGCMDYEHDTDIVYVQGAYTRPVKP